MKKKIQPPFFSLYQSILKSIDCFAPLFFQECVFLFFFFLSTEWCRIAQTTMQRRLRNRGLLKRPSRYVEVYGYEHGPGGVPDYAQRRSHHRRQRLEELRSLSPPLPIVAADTLPSPEVHQHCIERREEQQQSQMAVKPYMPRGKEKSISLYGVHAKVVGEEEQLLVRGESIKVRCKSGVTHVGALQDIQLRLNFGSQLMIQLRPYHGCRELDPYVEEREREWCIKSPDQCVWIDLNQAVSITKYHVHHNPEDTLPADHHHHTMLLYRAYVQESRSWCPVEKALHQERLQQQQEEEEEEEEGEEEYEEEEEEHELPPDMYLLKHSFESDFGTPGFLDFLASPEECRNRERAMFETFVTTHYLEPLLEVGPIENAVGRRRLKESASLYERCKLHALDPVDVRTEFCYFCGVCTLCDHMLEPTQKRVSHGCAKRFRVLRDLMQFNDEHRAAHPTLTRPYLNTLHQQFVNLLYQADRCLARPIRERHTLSS